MLKLRKEEGKMIPPEMTALEILALAVKSEIDAANFYRRLSARVKADLLRQKINFLVSEEKKHRQVLLRLSRQRFGRGPEPLPAKGITPGFTLSSWKNLTLLELFAIALKAERAAEAFYSEARKVVKDDLAGRILDYLRRVERSHAALILSEVDLLRRFPEYYDIAGFHFGDEFVHIGP